MAYNFFHLKTYKYISYLSLLVFFTGCATQSNNDSSRTSDESPGKIRLESGSLQQANSALRHLQQLAEEAVAKQDYDRANALLERALRLAPYQAATYLELARVKSASGDVLQALVFAERGLLYCKHPVCQALNRFIQEANREPSSQSH